MIELQDIQKADREALIDILLDEKKMPFSISIPKSSMLFNSSNADVAMDYAKLSYCGHLLKLASDSFDFEHVGIEDFSSTLFTVSAVEFTNLADALLTISKGFLNVEDEEEEFDFMEGMSQYLSDVEEKKIDPTCESYLEVYRNFIHE